jgi:hypothetical protein
MHLILYLAKHPRDGRLFSGLTGRKICLRIILPYKMIINENQLTISGGTLLLFEQEVHNSKVTILLRSSDDPVIRINFPLRPAVY